MGAWQAEISESRRIIGEAINNLTRGTSLPRGQAPVDTLPQVAAVLKKIEGEIANVRSDLILTKEGTEARKVDAELTKTILEAWPSSAFSDKAAYIGAGLLAAGSGAFIFSLPLAFPYNLVPPLVLWAGGLALIVAGLYGLWKYDSERRAHFRKRTGV